MMRERLDQWCGRGILGLILSILVFGPLAYGAVRSSEFVILQALTVAVIFLWTLRIWLSSKTVLFFPPICYAVLAFVGYGIFRYYTAPIEYVARLELIKVLVYAFLFFAVLNNLARQDSTQIISATLIALAFALSLFAIFQFISHHDKIWGMIKSPQYAGRGSGTYNNPNSFAGFAEMILPLGLACILLSRFSHALKILFAYASLTIAAGIVVSLSRGGWLATLWMVMGLLIVLLFRRQFRLRYVILWAALLAIGVGFVAREQQVQKRFQQALKAGNADEGRFDYWNSALQIWREDIWLGAGPAHYNERFRQYRPEHLQMLPQFTHNDYLNTLADWGIVGLGLIVIFLFLFYAGVFKTWRYVQRNPGDLGSRNSNKTALVLGGSLGIAALVFHSFVDFNLHVPANAIVAVVLIALVTTYLRFATEKFWFPAGVAAKIFLSMIGLAGIFYLGWQTSVQFRENFWLSRAAQAENYSDAKLHLLQNALAVEPRNYETTLAIGEIYQLRSFNGKSDYETLAQEAIKWFQRSVQSNPFYPFTYLQYGMTLDWLDKNEEAAKYFERARQLDPNGYYTLAYEGWHLFQIGDYAGAQKEFQRSQRLRPNFFSENYLTIIAQKMAGEK
ncbi:MAG: O-antigen ligase family protein [Verrucomicrobiota bacterium]